MNYFTLENEIKEVMNIVTEEAGERQTGPVLSQRSLPPPNAFPEPHKLYGILMGQQDTLEIVSPCSSTVPLPGHQ